MTSDGRIPVALLLLRLSIFIVMFMWTLDKFVRPDHAASVYENYYFVGGFSRTVTLTIGALEIALLVGFILGIAKRCTYGAVLVLHGISTLSAYKHYAAPFEEGPNLLFFAAWPMLAACVSLYLLRDYDTLGVVRWAGRKSAGNELHQKRETMNRNSHSDALVFFGVGSSTFQLPILKGGRLAFRSTGRTVVNGRRKISRSQCDSCTN